MAIAIPVGLFWGEGATNLELLPKLILRALTALAAPLVVLAILSAIVTNEVKGRLGALMMLFYLINTLVAMLIGLSLSNLLQPGNGASLVEPGTAAPTLAKKTATELLMDLIPRSIGEPFTQNHLAQLVLLTLALGIGLVKIRDSQKARGEKSFSVVVDLLTIGFELLMKVLLWVVALVPLAVFGIVASSVGQKEGMRVFASLIWLIVVVVAGLAIQVDLVPAPDVGRRADVAPAVSAGFLERDGQHDQHGQHGRHDPDHLAIARAAGHLATIESVDRVHRDQLQQRRHRPLPGDGGPFHGTGPWLPVEHPRPDHDHADNSRGQRGGGRNSVGKLCDHAPDLCGRPASVPTRSRSCSRSTGSWTVAGPLPMYSAT